jgi:methanogenic corrinoid protein MtbC1
MAEARGFTTHFGGGGIANDELLAELNERKPDVVMFFSSTADDAPRIRELIDKVREIGACPNVQFAVGGGIFARASGLAEEIGADLWAHTPLEMLQTLMTEPQRRATPAQQTVGRQKQKREIRAAA